MTRKALSMSLIVGLAGALAYLMADRATTLTIEPPKQTTNQMACASCHAGRANTYRKMEEKRDDPAFKVWIETAHTGTPRSAGVSKDQTEGQ